ncbi:MAG: hypothetical protein OER97_07365 [Gammaproteobacteria bacterium]|nr:hypothetical protein [Gammaproteobacteria bacterium]
MTFHDLRWTRRELPATLVKLALAGLLIAVFPLALPVANEPARAELLATVYSTGAIIALLLFAPLHGASLRNTFGWCAAVTSLLLIFVFLDPATRASAKLTPALALIVFLLGATLGILARRLPPAIVIGLFALLALVPMWAGPMLELANNPVWANRLVMYVSPLTALATALDFDYLRTAWFYEYSAVATMRYDYPNFVNIILLLAVLPVAAVIRRYSTKDSAFQYSSEAHP